MRALVPVLLAITAGGIAAQAHPGWDATGLQLTRAELQALLERHEQTAASSSYSSALRQQARAEADLIRSRLEHGDLRVGDRVMLNVQGHLDLTDTFSVVDGRMLVLPQVGEVSLVGVLRSELQQHMTEAIGRFIRNPTVLARSLMRIEVLGAVGQPGYHLVASDIVISDALMAAGGPTGNAQVDRMRVERAGEVIWPGERLREAVIEGRTLDQLNLRAGDSLIMPERRSRFQTVRDVAAVLGTATSVVFLLTRIF